jgi:hypothetical protein
VEWQYLRKLSYRPNFVAFRLSGLLEQTESSSFTSQLHPAVMAEPQDTRNGLRGLYQDLCALSSSQLPNVDRLCFELETHIQDFRKLLDKPAKNNASRQAVLSGK